MKKLGIVLLLLLCVTFCVRAYRGVIVAWNPNPPHEGVTNYIVTISTDHTNFFRGAWLTNSEGLRYHTNWPIVGTFTNYHTGPVTGLVLRAIGYTNAPPTNLTHFPVVNMPWGTNDVPGVLYIAAQAQNRFARSLYSEIVSVTNRPGRLKGWHLLEMGHLWPRVGFSNLASHFSIESAPTATGAWSTVLSVHNLDTNALSDAITWHLPLGYESRFWRMRTNGFE